MRLHLPVDLADVLALGRLTVERHLQTFLDKAPLDPLDLALADLQHLRNFQVRAPALAPLGFVAVEQDQRVDDFLRSMFAFGYEGPQLVDFFCLERDDVFSHPAIFVQLGLGTMSALEALPTFLA